MTSSEFESAFAEAEVRLADFPHVLASAGLSEARLAKARGALASVVADGEGYAVFALGSLGRMEVTSGSDLDLAFVYECARVPDPHPIWRAIREHLSSASFAVSDKTFAEPVKMCELVTNVGGEAETNRSLTYRVLLLTEGEWLGAASHARELRGRLLSVFRDAVVTRGRYLTSLSNDLHRYYRTLCVDYRHKVEERGKDWGIRYIKLRHSRKLWHLGNVCLESTALLEARKRSEDDGFHDGYLSEHLADPPLMKVLAALRLIGQAALIRPVLVAYDCFLRELDRPAVRAELAAVKFEEREGSPAFSSLKLNADDLNQATIAVVRALLAADCGDHLIRYGVL